MGIPQFELQEIELLIWLCWPCLFFLLFFFWIRFPHFKLANSHPQQREVCVTVLTRRTVSPTPSFRLIGKTLTQSSDSCWNRASTSTLCVSCEWASFSAIFSHNTWPTLQPTRNYISRPGSALKLCLSLWPPTLDHSTLRLWVYNIVRAFNPFGVKRLLYFGVKRLPYFKFIFLFASRCQLEQRYCCS